MLSSLILEIKNWGLRNVSGSSHGWGWEGKWSSCCQCHTHSPRHMALSSLVDVDVLIQKLCQGSEQVGMPEMMD